MSKTMKAPVAEMFGELLTMQQLQILLAGSRLGAQAFGKCECDCSHKWL